MAKSHNFSFTNQLLTQAHKNDKRGCWRNHPITKVNITEIVKKNKNKAKDLSYVENYIYKQEGQYANKYPKK